MTTHRGIFLRAVCVLGLSLAVIFLILLSLAETLQNKIRLNEVNLAFSAIEAGALQFARNYSGSFADSHLARLMDASGLTDRNFRHANITSGEEFSDEFASWEHRLFQIDKVKIPSCISTTSKIYSFEDSVYPYQVSISIDKCKSLPSFSSTKNWIFILGFLAFFVGLVSVVFSFSPVLQSIGFSIKLLDRDSMKPNDELFKKVTFAPIAELTRLALSSLQNEKYKAIAQTTQMLAHDVRKPFTMIQALLSLLQSSSNQAKTDDLIKNFVPEVNRAILSVNAMISDVMEVGSNSIPITESTSPVELLSLSLIEVFKYDEKSTIDFRYDFNHSRKIDVNRQKLIRVFSNIITNANQAMNGTGRIWFETKDQDDEFGSYVEFCIGNEGSAISAADRENLFEAFFTKNKKDGTGLGLAISKKIINSHGGSIRCESSTEVGVEFYFTLPANSDVLVDESLELPSSSFDL